jgi:nucleotide-binding universal stress UspA family protein
MLGTLLVPLDGSGMAERALAWATLLQRVTTARLDLVWTTPGVVRPERAGAGLSATTMDVWDGVPAAEVGSGPGDPAVTILDAIGCRRPDLVVMAADSWSNLGLGSDVAREVARRAPVPIVLIPTGTALPDVDQGARRILVALDGSAYAEQALLPAQSLADALESDLILLRVVSPKAAMVVGLAHDEASLASARRYVEDLAGALHARHRQVSALAVVGNPLTMIPAVGRTQRASLIAMTTRGRGADTHAELGDVASEILRSTGVPLLLVPPIASDRPAPWSRSADTGA